MLNCGKKSVMNRAMGDGVLVWWILTHTSVDHCLDRVLALLLRESGLGGRVGHACLLHLFQRHVRKRSIGMIGDGSRSRLM
jgi:hypothetical protein